MTPIDALRTYALVGLPVGLFLGMALAAVARHEDGWGGYGSFRRRAARLGHICAVMIPVIAGAYATWLDGHAAPAAALSLASGLWIAGGIALCASLFVAAWRPALRAVLVLPAATVVAGAVLFAVAGLS